VPSLVVGAAAQPAVGEASFQRVRDARAAPGRWPQSPLVETAVKFSDKDTTVRLTYSVPPEPLAPPQPLVVESDGRAISDSALAKFFDIHFMDDAVTAGGDLGSGPPVAGRILSLFDGSVSVANRNRLTYD
jgi:K+-sensing histidine kinase KdpD